MKVTVCIPTYNQAPYIEATIRSAYNQEYKPEEIIVSDDCSTDGTIGIVQELAREIEIIRIIQQPKNLGIAANPDACLRAAKTELIVKLDSDDLLMPGYIKKLVAAMESHPLAGYAHANVREIDGTGQYGRLRKLKRQPGFQDADSSLKESLKGYRVAANILMFRREALERVGYINTDMNFAEDYYLNVSIAAVGYGNVFIAEELAAYRVWDDDNQSRQRRKLAEIEGLTTVFNEKLEPEYRAKGWDTALVSQRRAELACRHANALSWSVFTDSEKEAIKSALLRLSNAPVVHRAIKMEASGLGWLYHLPNNLLTFLKAQVKRILYS